MFSRAIFGFSRCTWPKTALLPPPPIMTSRNLTSYFRSMAVIEIITGDGKLILRDREIMTNFF